jgi:hypothetical protein
VFPGFLRSLLSIQTGDARPPDAARDVEDSDFDLMFSSRTDPVVGSYRASADLPGDRNGNGNTDVGSRSYY